MKILRILGLTIGAFLLACTGENDSFVDDPDVTDAGADAAADPCSSYEYDCCHISSYTHYGYTCVLLGRLNKEPQCNIGSGDLPQAADTLGRFCGEVYSFECTCDETTGCATITVDSESTHLDHEVQCPGDF